MDDIKRCSKWKMDCLKTKFHKKLGSRDGLNTHCKNCVIQKQKQYDIENRDRKKE